MPSEEKHAFLFFTHGETLFMNPEASHSGARKRDLVIQIVRVTLIFQFHITLLPASKLKNDYSTLKMGIKKILPRSLSCYQGL